MIRMVRGKSYPETDGSLMVETASGLGLRIFIARGSKFYTLPKASDVTVYTSMVVRDDSISLYGFYDMEELSMFELLKGVNGIGAKAALAIMGSLSLADLTRAIAEGDSKTLTKADGVGKKTAAKIILDLKDKVKAPYDAAYEYVEADKDTPAYMEEVVSALISLGYSKREAEDAVDKVKAGKDELTVEEYIVQALRNL
jgi:Holliday junction DNA helicase RuvA